MTGVFQKWQPVYAERGIATFPVREVEAAKRPAVRNYSRIGLPASAALTSRLGSAEMLGFMCGSRNRITVLDVDSKDERILADALAHHGKTPVIVRTGSGKHHAWYRHNGERRRIRPWRGLPIDLLGGGFVVAPPSDVRQGQYQFIEGSLDDLDRLPILNNAPAPNAVLSLRNVSGTLGVRRGNRNNTLFAMLGREAHHVDDFEALLDVGRTRNSEFAEPLDDGEMVKVAASVWKMHREGRNRFGRYGAYHSLEIVDQLATTNPDALALLSVLKANNGPSNIFPIANAMANSKIALGRHRLSKARKDLIEAHLVVQVSPNTRDHAALYRWPKASGTKDLD
jgi:Bifunctional DNA primase/polymerase, N-terminal/Primase C terminal 1 (PriCT-1)